MRAEKKMITYELINMGFRLSHVGYKYISELLYLAISGRDILPLKAKGYTYLREIYGKSIESIDKNISNAIDYAFTYGNIEYLYYRFKESIDITKGKPTNKQFLLTMLYLLK